VSERWDPRPHDHLVEPLFGGLGHEAPAQSGARRRAGSTLRWVALIAVLASLLALLASVLAS